MKSQSKIQQSFKQQNSIILQVTSNIKYLHFHFSNQFNLTSSRYSNYSSVPNFIIVYFFSLRQTMNFFRSGTGFKHLCILRSWSWHTGEIQCVLKKHPRNISLGCGCCYHRGPQETAKQAHFLFYPLLPSFLRSFSHFSMVSFQLLKIPKYLTFI